MGDGPATYDSAPGIQAPSLVGEVLDGRYRLTKKLGEGGMGEVYAAQHIHIDKRYAIKLLRPEIVSNQEAVKRFYQEAKSSSQIKHPNIIAIEDFGSLSDGRVYMCMELLDGAPLNDMIQQPMPVDRLLNILIQTGHGLAAAHTHGIVHRDMKPENIYVTIGPKGEDIPKLLDFGIAKVSGNDGQNHLTRTGTIFGTPFYMAPEQALGNPVDARTDIYAVGVIMYEVFAGSLPFQGESFMGILTQHITTEPEPVAQRAAKAGRQLPGNLGEIVTRAMQKNPAQRFSSMDELVGQLIDVYRSMVGPGMSTYMDAFSAPSASHPVQRTPAPITGPVVMQPTGSGPRMMAPQTGPSQQVAAYDPSGSHHIAAPKKSKTGLIIALLAVLLVGGGVTVFLVTQKGDGGGGSGSQVAVTDPKVVDPKVDPKVVDPKVGDPKVVDPKATDPKIVDPKATVADAGVAAVTVDAATVAVAVDAAVVAAAPADAAELLAPKPIKVFLKTASGGNFEIYQNGKKVAKGPGGVMVDPALGSKFVLKERGYKDKEVSVDGKSDEVTITLEPKPGAVVIRHPVGPVGPVGGTGSGVGSGPVVVTPPPPPPPPTVNCSAVITDPHSAACIKQYCAGHKSDARCEME